MKLLSPAEREQLEYYAAVASGAPRVDSYDTDPVYAIKERLENAGRIMWVRAPDDDPPYYLFEGHITDMGRKALRVDALMRAWGMSD